MTTSKRTLSKTAAVWQRQCAAEEIDEVEEEERNIPAGLNVWSEVQWEEQGKCELDSFHNWMIFQLWIYVWSVCLSVSNTFHLFCDRHTLHRGKDPTLWFSCFHIDARGIACCVVWSVRSLQTNCWRKLFILLFPSDNTRRDFSSCVCDRWREWRDAVSISSGHISMCCMTWRNNIEFVAYLITNSAGCRSIERANS